MPTTQATRARLRIGRCYPGQVLEVGVPAPGFWAWVRGIVYEWPALSNAPIVLALEWLSEATGSQPSSDPGISRTAAVRCCQRRRWGTRWDRGEQCRRAPGSSRPSMYRRPAPPLCRGRLLPDRRRVGSSPSDRNHRDRPRDRARATVARSTAMSNDEFWSLAAGQWMLAHHSFMGLDPFSYTESHRRWVTDEWGSEIALAQLFRLFGNAAYSVYAIILGRTVPRGQRGIPRALGPGVAGSPPSSSCWPSVSPGSRRATVGSTSRWSGCRSNS